MRRRQPPETSDLREVSLLVRQVPSNQALGHGRKFPATISGFALWPRRAERLRPRRGTLKNAGLMLVAAHVVRKQQERHAHSGRKDQVSWLPVGNQHPQEVGSDQGIGGRRCGPAYLYRQGAVVSCTGTRHGAAGSWRLDPSRQFLGRLRRLSVPPSRDMDSPRLKRRVVRVGPAQWPPSSKFVNPRGLRS